jgi:hypothetical protein
MVDDFNREVECPFCIGGLTGSSAHEHQRRATGFHGQTLCKISITNSTSRRYDVKASTPADEDLVSEKC